MLPLLAGLLAASAVALTVSSAHGNEPEVVAPVGVIRGQSRSVEGVGVEEFLGIPYGAAARFGFATARGSIGQLNATTFTGRCPQPFLGGDFPNAVPMSEDCLLLNVYRSAGVKRDDNIAASIKTCFMKFTLDLIEPRNGSISKESIEPER